MQQFLRYRGRFDELPFHHYLQHLIGNNKTYRDTVVAVQVHRQVCCDKITSSAVKSIKTGSSTSYCIATASSSTIW